MDPCHAFEILAAYREGGLEAPVREGVERHAAACGRCRGILLHLDLRDGAEPLSAEALRKAQALRRPVRGYRLAWAAAVLLCIALGWRMLSRSQPSDRATEAAAPPVSAFPGGVLEASYLAPGMDLVLEAGARVRAEGGRLRGEAGRFWLEASGKPVTLELPGATVTLSDGTLAVSLDSSRKAAWLVQEAAADEDALAEVAVLRGQAGVSAGGKMLRLPAGIRLLRDAAGWREAPLFGEQAAALWEARSAALVSGPGQALVSEPRRLGVGSPSVEASLETPGTWRWVTVLTGRKPSTELGFTLAASGWHQWVAGLGRVSPGAREVLELAWDGERLVGRLDGVPCFSALRANLGRALRPAPREAWGISVWQGEATVARSLLQEAR